MDEPIERTPPPRPSKTPSWVLLGFLLGALVVWTLPREAATTSAPPKTTVVRLERPKETDIEAVFAAWGQYAVWDQDLTEVALWDVDMKSYSLFYEILRRGDAFYVRSIPKLTRPILTHGVHVQSPLLYTETEQMRQDWLTRNTDNIKPPEALSPDGRKP